MREFTTDNAEDVCNTMCNNLTPEKFSIEMADFSNAFNAVTELATASQEFVRAYNDLLNADNPKLLLAYEQECEEKLASVIYAKLREIKELNKNGKRDRIG